MKTCGTLAEKMKDESGRSEEGERNSRRNILVDDREVQTQTATVEAEPRETGVTKFSSSAAFKKSTQSTPGCVSSDVSGCRQNKLISNHKRRKHWVRTEHSDELNAGAVRPVSDDSQLARWIELTLAESDNEAVGNTRDGRDGKTPEQSLHMSSNFKSWSKSSEEE